MADEFKVAMCRSNRAGEAHLSLQHVPTGARIDIENEPFDDRPDENREDQHRRIARQSIEMVRALLGYLQGELADAADWPDSDPGIGPSPTSKDAKSAFTGSGGDPAGRRGEKPVKH